MNDPFREGLKNSAEISEDNDFTILFEHSNKKNEEYYDKLKKKNLPENQKSKTFKITNDNKNRYTHCVNSKSQREIIGKPLQKRFSGWKHVT